jgi:hypothetical protein
MEGGGTLRYKVGVERDIGWRATNLCYRGHWIHTVGCGGDLGLIEMEV